ncbi:MAG TPA: DUF2510 domain-containing protein, partial [Propionibacteriaceae bacterium]|nr:DUF2510 domain-containing protein [Propionibacteriaceae bacterium]
MTEPPERQPLPPAGWYRDPAHPGRERWWDGLRWSDQVRIAETTPSIAGVGRPAAPYTSTAPRPYTPQVHAEIRPVARPVPTHVPAVAAAATGLASFGRRFVATVIDNMLVSFVVVTGMYALVNNFQNRMLAGLHVMYDAALAGSQSAQPDDLRHLFMLIWYAVIIITAAYGTISLGVWSRTLGQRLAGIAVCPVDKPAD